jgi:CBS-domain-containing membrane protein
MTPKQQVITAKPETPVTEVAQLLHAHSFSGMPVVNEYGVVMGMINERDFLASKSQVYLPTYIKLLSEMDYVQGGDKHLPYVTDQIVRTKAADIMNRQVAFARPDMTMEQVIEMFATKGNNPLAVTDEQNRLVGIIARSDLLKPMVGQGTKLRPADTQASMSRRPIDDQVEYITKDFQSRFAYVAKARANIWITTTIVLIIVAFVAGIVYVVDPNIL